MRTKFRTIIPILIAVITAISVIPAYAEVIPRESLPENTPQAAVDTAEVLIGATLAKVEYGMGYADARAETNRIIFEAFLSNQTKYDDLNNQLTYLQDELVVWKNSESREKNVKKRLSDFRKVLEHNETLVEFDRAVFESIIEKVIVGGYDDDGNADPSMLTFVYKTGFTNNVDSSKHKLPRKNSKDKKEGSADSKTKLCSFTNNEDNNLCSFNSDNACGDGSFDVKG